jgi:rod shape-determining protein MreD
MRVKIFKPIVLFLILLFLQIKVVPIISLEGVIPDLIIIYLAFYTLQNGRLWGLVAAAIAGFVFDLVSGGLVGGAMFSNTIAIFITGLFYKEQKSEFYIHSYFFALITLIASVINAAVYSMVAHFDLYSRFLSFLLFQGLLPGIYTASISLLFTVLYPKKGFR